jgi:periplasmic protein TonB
VALIKEADRYKRYPAQAIERGWQGRVEVRLVIGANTFIKSATIRTSSGYAVLDDLALDMVRKGKPLVQIPAALRGREFTVDVPVIFSLRAG